MLEARGLTFAGLQDFLGSANVADANISALPLEWIAERWFCIWSRGQRERQIVGQKGADWIVYSHLHNALHNKISRNLFGCVGECDKSHATQNIPLCPCSYTCMSPAIILLNGTLLLRRCVWMHPGFAQWGKASKNRLSMISQILFKHDQICSKKSIVQSNMQMTVGGQKSLNLLWQLVWELHGTSIQTQIYQSVYHRFLLISVRKSG